MGMRRKRYIVGTVYTSIKRYEVLANDSDEAKQKVRDGFRRNCIDIEETFDVTTAYRKETS